jgi:tripartite ATP-independent transporter DctM subunit
MSSTLAETPRAAKVGIGLAGLSVAFIAVAGSIIGGLVVLLALLGLPLFAVMGGSAEILWMLHPDAAYHHVRFLAPTVLDERFADNPVIVTIPLFTFVGYVLAEAKTPNRLVAAARAVLGWLPGGLAIVCVIASAVFTVLTGGSGVTIIAVGGLLYPALRMQGYSDKFALGLVTTGGSVGLLLPSLPLTVYGLFAHVDLTLLFKAVLVPGTLIILALSAYCAIVASRETVPRERPQIDKMASAIWTLKWELGVVALLGACLGTGLTTLDEAAGITAFYVVTIEFFIYRDLSWKTDLTRIAKASMMLAGAIIVILAMANALMNYVVDQHIPIKLLSFMVSVGIEHRWQFLIVMNIILLLLGMLMEGFSAIIVAVPLIIPFVADLGRRHVDEKMSPLQLAMIFLLNLEIAYCMPPLGLNLFLSSFRFNRPVSSLYKVVMPFVGILVVGLGMVSYVPWFSTVAITGDIAAARAGARKNGLPPLDAWIIECVQEDPNNPKPCSPEDRAAFPGGQPRAEAAPAGGGQAAPAVDTECNPDFEDCPRGGTQGH